MDRILPARRSLPAVAALAAALIRFPAATAEEIILTAVLDGPAVNAETAATGAAHFVLDTGTGLVSYHITYERLLGEEIEAHLHPGLQAPAIHHLPLGTPKIGTWEPTERRLAELLAGEIVIVIHTDVYPEGEIGGWLAVETTPVEGAAWAAVRQRYR